MLIKFLKNSKNLVFLLYNEMLELIYRYGGKLSCLVRKDIEILFT